MRVTLRPYQEEALAKIAAAEQRGVRKQMLHAATGTGKGLAVGTPVLCGDGGWRLVEDLRAGDSVIGSDGRATRVVAVFHRGVQPRWAVEFDDRHVVVVDSDHLWAVATDSDLSRGRSWRTMSTEAIAAAGVAMPAGRLRWRVPVVAPIEPAGPSPVLPVDPYILGVLLADGALSLPGVRFTPGDAAIAAEVKDRLPGGMTLSAFTAPGRATGYRIVKASVAGRANPVRAALAGLGVLGCRAADKFIPPVYLRASEADRRGLLAGLMDCDGWAGSMVEYTTVSDRLAEDVVALVRSLGGVVRVRRRQRPGYTYNGEPRIGQPAWDISVRLGQCPFLLQRKADAWRAVPRAAPTRKIRSVVPVERGETVCIKVAAPDGLFVVGGYVVTHNTVVFSALAERRGDRTLILAHRDELIGQAAAKVQEVWPEASIGVVKAEVNEVHAHVVVASVQTLSRDRRLRSLIDAWEEPVLGGSSSPFGLVVVDECHHAAAATYRKVLDALRAGEPDGPLLLGVTATPDRGDGQGLSDVFDEIVASYDIEWGIKAGYLCDLRGIRVALDGLDLGGVRTSRGDYQAGDLGDALAKAQVVPTAVRAWMEHARGRRTIVFTPTVALAADMAAAFECAGVNAAWVSGETPLEERRDTLARFADGRIDVVANCGVLTEGFDAPRTDCILIARPTKSRALYTQQVGRGTRKHPDKADCIVLDVVGATAAHSLVTVPSLFGFGAVDPKVARRVARGELSVAEAIAEADRQLVAAGRLRAEDAELFARMRSTIAWAAADHGGRRAFVKSLGADRGGAQRGQVWIRQVTAGQDVYVAEHVRDGLVARTLLAGAPLELVQGVAEDFVRSVAPAALVQSDAPWRRRAPSDRQLEAARKWRLRVDPGWSSGELSDALDAHIAARTRHRRRG